MAKSFLGTGVTIIDTSSDLPAASAALEGVMAFQKDTNELKICDGSVWRSVIDTDAPPSICLMNPTSVVNATNTNGKITFSAQSSISVNGIFSADFDNYRIVISEFTGSVAGGADLQMKLRAAGTDNSTNYAFSYLYSTNTTSGRTYNSGQTSLPIGSVAGTYKASMLTLDVINPFLAIETSMHTVGSGWGTTANIVYMGAATHLVSTSYDGFSINPSSGTFTGTIRVYGYRNSL